MSALVHAGIPHPLEQTPPRSRHPPEADTPPPPGADPLPETATAADGTHPTGMHSCFLLNFKFLWTFIQSSSWQVIVTSSNLSIVCSCQRKSIFSNALTRITKCNDTAHHYRTDVYAKRDGKPDRKQIKNLSKSTDRIFIILVFNIAKLDELVRLIHTINRK